MIRRRPVLRMPTRRLECSALRRNLDLDRLAPDGHSLSTAAIQVHPTAIVSPPQQAWSLFVSIRRPRQRAASSWRGLSSQPTEGAGSSSPKSSCVPSPSFLLSLNNPAEREQFLRDWFPEALHVNPWDMGASASWIPTLEARVRKNSHDGQQAERLYPSTGSRRASEPYDSVDAHWAEQVLQLDCVSRHVIQLLQELYLNQHPVSYDRVTTKRCLVVLNQLLRFGTGREESHALGDDYFVLAGRAERARAILSCMQRFEETSDAETSDSTSRERVAQRIGQRRPYQVPLPTRDVYQTVLRIYAESGTPHFAYEAAQHMTGMYSRHGYVELKPSGFHWNCVLLAWENAPSQCSSADGSDPNHPPWERAVPAAKMFLDNLSHMDDSCYKTIMRICRQGHANERAAELGGSVAVKIWQATIERAGLKDDQPEASSVEGGGAACAVHHRVPDLSSHFYAFFFQAIRGLPLTSPLRDAYFEAGFQRALEKGKVNAVLVNEFIVHNTSAPLYQKYIRPYFDNSWKLLKPAKAARKILDRMPASWRDRADDYVQLQGGAES